MLRPPAGRAGRLWLLRRLTVARRGRDVLEQKRRALMRQLDRLEGELAEAQRDWELEARAAEEWWQRAAVLAGERPLALACEAARGRAELQLVWRNALGVVFPAEVSVTGPETELFPAGGSSALILAAEAHTRALDAAARLGAAELAHRRTAAELHATTLRVRAIDRRWIPEHERALSTLELALDEGEREESVRIRWIAARTG